MAKILVNLEKKLYFPEQLVKGMIYMRVKEAQKVKKILLQIHGTEEVRSSKYIKPNTIFARRYLEANPAYLPNKKGEVFVDEYEFSKFINHQRVIYEYKEPQEPSKKEKDAKNHSKSLNKTATNNSEDNLEEREGEEEGEEEAHKPLDHSEDIIEAVAEYKEGDYQFPFVFKLPKKLPGTFCKMWLNESRVNYGRCFYKAAVKVELFNHTVMMRDEQEFLVQQKFWVETDYKTQRFILKFSSRFFCFKIKPLKFELYSYKKSYQFGEEIIIKLKSIGNNANLKSVSKVLGVFKREIKVHTAGGGEKIVKEVLLKEVKKPKLRPNGDIVYFCTTLDPKVHQYFPSYNGIYVSCSYYFSVILTTKKFLKKSKKTKKSIKILMNQYKPMVMARRFKYSKKWKCAGLEKISVVHIDQKPENLIPFKTLEDMKLEKKKRIQMDRIISMFGFFHYFDEIRRRRNNHLSQGLETLETNEDIPEGTKVDLGISNELYSPRKELVENEESVYEESNDEKFAYIERNLDFETYGVDDREYKEVILDQDAYQVNPYLIKLKNKSQANKGLMKRLFFAKQIKNAMGTINKNTMKIVNLSAKTTQKVLNKSANYLVGNNAQSAPNTPRRAINSRKSRRRSLPKRLMDVRASELIQRKWMKEAKYIQKSQEEIKQIAKKKIIKVNARHKIERTVNKVMRNQHRKLSEKNYRRGILKSFRKR